MSESVKRKTEIIAISSGKGGTGKTLITSCLGYALMRAGHKVLMIDADPGTDGLSLFMLGPDGMDTIGDIGPPNTFRWVLSNLHSVKKSNHRNTHFDPYDINRKHDYGIIYNALISGKGIYGDIGDDTAGYVLPHLDIKDFQEAIKNLFETLRTHSEFDYVLVDTRGGFSFESTSICALANSFIVVTEADYTNFYQDRNLVKRINEIAQERNSQPLLRGIIVNKTTHGEEKDFRLALVNEFPIKFNDTYPVPLDLDAIEAYRHQQIPFVEAEGSEFAASILQAFSRIMHLVTSRWDENRIDKWNELVREISTPYKEKHSFTAWGTNWLKTKAGSIIVITLLAIAFTSYNYYQRSQEREREDYLYAVFSTETPPSQRISYLISLYEEGIKTFNGVDISMLDLSQITLSSIQLQRGYLVQTVLRQTDLSNGNLRGADLTGVNAIEAILQGTDLAGAILEGANLTKAILFNANLKDADFQEANLESAQGLTLEQLSEVKTLYKAKLDSELLKQIEEDIPHLLRKPMFDANQEADY